MRVPLSGGCGADAAGKKRMKIKNLLVIAAVVAISGTSVAPAYAGKACAFGPASASNPGQYFKQVLSAAYGWNPLGLNIDKFLDYWWDLTNGTNDAQTVGDFIKRDCSN